MRAFVFVLLVACGGSSKPTPETPASSMLDCSKVADHVATTVSTDKPRPGATHAAVKGLVETRCTADKWSDEILQCLFVIKTVQEGRECATKMTDEQRAAIKTSAKELRQANAGEPVEDDNSSDWIKHVVQDKHD